MGNYYKKLSCNEQINLNESNKPKAYQIFFGGDNWYYGYPEAEQDARKEAKRLYGDDSIQEVWEDEWGDEIEDLTGYDLVYANERRNESININEYLSRLNINFVATIRQDLMDYFSENYGYVKPKIGNPKDVDFQFDVFNNLQDFRVATEITEDYSGYEYLSISVIAFKGTNEEDILQEIYDILAELGYDVECNKFECKVYLEKH